MGRHCLAVLDRHRRRPAGELMRRFALIIVPYLWLFALFLVPFAIVLKGQSFFWSWPKTQQL